ncbi:uncharacterized protein LOC126642055 [Myiozetetes cayanensis]|uniref:uncharacterized protein LOC126642055 n=1 Tax=Myiozetetes cayanensis TaxID=478635 RepID=UPI00216027BE|nr:uncharacterized protein LOC126642055 [Myiozetetes cayanensis]
MRLPSASVLPPVGWGWDIPCSHWDSTVSPALHHPCWDGAPWMLHIPIQNEGHSWDVPHSQQELVGGPAPQCCATCTPSLLGIPDRTVCPGRVSGPCPGLVAISPGAAGPRASPAWNGERERPEPEPGSRARRAEQQREQGRSSGWHMPSSALGDTTALGTPLGTPWGQGPAMARLLLPLLLLSALGSTAQLRRRPAWDDGGEAQRPPSRGCANLTLVLDNWKFAITSQLRNLLLADHHTVLPDYGRIPALSGALDELYRDFRALKEQLGGLSDRFAHLEASVERLSRARGAAAAPPRRGGVPLSPRRAPGTPQ